MSRVTIPDVESAHRNAARFHVPFASGAYQPNPSFCKPVADHITRPVSVASPAVKFAVALLYFSGALGQPVSMNRVHGASSGTSLPPASRSFLFHSTIG